MKKVFVLAPGESWIVDRFVTEWNTDNADIVVTNPMQADVVWLMADWAWRRVPLGLLQQKKVLTTVHHVVPEKFDAVALADFRHRDAVTTAYHTPNQHTHDFIRPLTEKPIHVIPYWGNQRIWRPTGTRADLRRKHGLSEDSYLIGSFQRDTEGNGIPQGIFNPKLEKGPDMFADFVIELAKTNDMWAQTCGYAAVTAPHVVLAGWRRQYLMRRLDDAGVAYTYFELPSQEVVNELYQTLDLYAVTARYEGGPQALIECGLLGIPVVSRDVGMASQVLPPTAINDRVFFTQQAIPNVEYLKLPQGYEPYRKLIEGL